MSVLHATQKPHKEPSRSKAKRTRVPRRIKSAAKWPIKCPKNVQQCKMQEEDEDDEEQMMFKLKLHSVYSAVETRQP